ncbi:MAG: serine/threonine protein kinase [Gemmataceae bacterium]|nr:serine/threonine protein kinase [Gemmataceae bacterium]
MTATPPMDRRTFLKNVQASGLVSRHDLKALLKKLPDSNRGKVIARTLVEWGLLTRFQAELLLIGRTTGFVLGQYRILDQIGQGGMGKVFKATHQTMGRVVALKVLTPQQVNSAKARELFQREVRAAGRLMHPNIVTAYDAGCADGRDYLAMEFVDGPNLERLLCQRGPLPVGWACDLMRQAADGLQYAADMGMVHRDIKPSNLLVQQGHAPGSPCVVKILDFGLARLHQPTQAGIGGKGTILAGEHTVMGTPDYLSPEQSRSLHAVDIRSDLYSLGCTFYHLLTGQVPFPGGTSLEKLVRHGSEEPVPAEALRPDLIPPVSAVVRRLMAKDPAARYQTPAELAAALAPFCEPGPIDWSVLDTGTMRCADTSTATPGTSIPTRAADPAAVATDANCPATEAADRGPRSRRAVLWVGALLGGLAALTATLVALLTQ